MIRQEKSNSEAEQTNTSTYSIDDVQVKRIMKMTNNEKMGNEKITFRKQFHLSTFYLV